MKAKDDFGEYHYLYGKTADIVESKYILLRDSWETGDYQGDVEVQAAGAIASSGSFVLQYYMLS